MRLPFGLELVRAGRKSVPSPVLDNRGGWFRILEPFTGAWQRNVELRPETVLAYSAVYTCISLISGDISKLRLRLMERDADGIWTETESPAFSPVLRKPNRYQDRIQFLSHWIISKLTHGNTYVLKERDNRGIVRALYILDPGRTRPLVTPRGEVFYQLSRDNLSAIEDSTLTVPASEIIHDRFNTLFHPLIGVSPIYACGMAAMQGLEITATSANFFRNGARPGGILTAPHNIPDATAARLKAAWEKEFSGDAAGKVAVLGDDLKYEAMGIKATDAQLIEQLKWSAETVCACFHVPAYMAGVAPPPNISNVEALAQLYYSQCLQVLIESLELALDEGLGLHEQPKTEGRIFGTELDLDGLLRMDTATAVKAAADAIGAGFLSPDEARRRFDLKPVPGGSTPYLQQQNFSLAALAKRDAQDDPFSRTPPASQAPPSDVGDETKNDDGDAQRAAIVRVLNASKNRYLRAAA